VTAEDAVAAEVPPLEIDLTRAVKKRA
jgi:hypothetical protein